MAFDYLRLLQLRGVVAALGESTMAGWWPSDFLSPMGQTHLGYVFPRSGLSAGIRSASSAAKIVHDSSIGVGSVYHLFRLPGDMERGMEDALRKSGDANAAELEKLLGNQDALLECLAEIAGNADGKTASGPLRLGSERDLRKKESLARLAAIYVSAFRSKTRVFPYYLAEGPAR